MPAQQRDKGRVEKALVADLDRVAQFAPLRGLGPAAVGEPLAAAFGEGRGGFGVARQQCEEMVEPLGRETEARRELPQHRAELLFEPQDAGGKEIGERGLDLAQPPDVGDEARPLDREDKTVRGLVVPPGKGVGALQPVKRAVDLDRVDLPAGIGQLIGMQQTRRVEVAAPRRIGPARDADPHGPAAAHHKAPQSRATRPPC